VTRAATAFLLASLLLPRSAGACPGGLDGTFLQLTDTEVRFSRAQWAHTMDELASLELGTIVVQHTGDPWGSFEGRYGRTPITNILGEADTRGMQVWLGLAHSPGWPGTVPSRFAPLADPRAVEQLGRLCEAHPSCVGFYLSPEIDDSTWRDRRREVRRLLLDAVQTMLSRVPNARFAIAPFFTRLLAPAEHAAWWVELLAHSGIDVVMLQGGTGTGRTSADDVRRWIRPLARALRRLGIETWLVVELFRQRAGPPFDGALFAADPAPFSAVRDAMLESEPLVRSRIAFSVLDYMYRRTPAAVRLRRDYRAHCRRALAVAAPAR
jgi:uncharacterized protein DUF4434